MKKIILFVFSSFVLISCKKTDEKLIADVKTNPVENSEVNKMNPVTIEYSEPINGYKIAVMWLIDRYDSKYTQRFIGPAIMKLTNIETKEVSYVNHPEFSENITKENEKFIKTNKINEYEKEFLNNTSFTQSIKFKLPKIGKPEGEEQYEEGYLEYIPFFFKDVNFDETPELILVHGRFFEKGGFSNEVYRLDHFAGKMVDEPFSKFSNFYMNAAGESGNYDKSEFDPIKKTITQSYISGAMTSGKVTYFFNNGTIIKKINEDLDEGELTTTVTNYDEDGSEVSKQKSVKKQS